MRWDGWVNEREKGQMVGLRWVSWEGDGDEANGGFEVGVGNMSKIS